MSLVLSHSHEEKNSWLELSDKGGTIKNYVGCSQLLITRRSYLGDQFYPSLNTL